MQSCGARHDHLTKAEKPQPQQAGPPYSSAESEPCHGLMLLPRNAKAAATPAATACTLHAMTCRCYRCGRRRLVHPWSPQEQRRGPGDPSAEERDLPHRPEVGQGQHEPLTGGCQDINYAWPCLFCFLNLGCTPRWMGRLMLTCPAQGQQVSPSVGGM